jgi:outer membrane protein OmpA-like peptidoglycan-associated protein
MRIDVMPLGRRTIMNNKRIIQAVVGLALPLSMAACSQSGYMGSPHDLDALNANKPTGPTFSQDLSKDYLDLADTNKSEYNWPIMSLWAHKGMEADRGNAVAPETVEGWSYGSLQLGGVNGTYFQPDSEAAVPLNNARGRLVTMLGSDAPTRFPQWAATAQTKFECWLEATHEALSPVEKAAECKKGFDDAMLLIYAPVKQAQAAPAAAVVKMAPAAYVVFFDFDKSDLKPESRQIIAGAVKAINAGNVVRINVDGFTDTMGTTPYNIKLSDRRGDAVEAELVRDGIPSGNIAVEGLGKTDLLVQTADEVREPKNRRATIELTVQ